MALLTPSSSFCYGFTYDVFLSFRGLDTRYGFTGNLYIALHNKGIHTFIDNEELERGQEITPSLLKAIEESRIAIIILSENYASSSFCLDELVKILDDIKGKGRLVLPIFYDIDPSIVRKQAGSYGEALAMHEERFKNNMQRLHKWRSALQQVANLSGWHFKKGEGYEYEFIGNIVEHVSNKMNRVALPVADYPVGLEPRMLEINSLLDVGSEEVNMIGIHGNGGIGKTTLALAVYNLIADHFEALCFLENVRENSNKHGLEHLQKIILSETLGEKKIKLSSVKQGISIIKHRLQQKKVLLILDDVDKIEQLEALVGGSDWLGSGSRVIITSRDKHLFESHGVNRTYELNVLDEKDALQLLTWKAFKAEKFHPSYLDVMKRVVAYASGLPLALTVMGSNLFGKNIQEWESALHRYEIIPNKEIQNILKVSFDALEEDEQSVFLDIACFYTGTEHTLTSVEKMLHVHYDACMKYHIGVLVEKSLIKINWFGGFSVHDLIEDMAKEIVRLESPDEPGNRSRLWFHEDIIQVLEDNTGTSAIKTIYLICENEVELDESAFKKMKNLKTLVIIIMKGGHFTKGPKYLPNSLRVVKWEGYPSEYLPQDFHPKKLAILTLRKSCITSLETDSLKKFLNVKILNFDEANCLTEIPDVSCLLNLEEFSFHNCNNLIKIHESVGLLDKLKVLSARGCTKLRRFPPIKLASLEQLDLSFCLNLKSFPEILGKIENITELVLEGIPIIDLPFSFQNLTHLQTLQLRCCGTFSLPRNLFMMPNLVVIIAWVLNGLIFPKQSEGEQTVILTVTSNVERLYLPYCRLSNDFFATSLTWFRNVKELILTGNNFTILPECIKEYHLLSELHVDDCKYLREVRGIPPNLEIFSALWCKSWTSTEMLLNQELHEAGSTMFKLPGSRIPDWFEHCSSGGSISFWFRNKFPAIAVCLVPDSMFVISSIYPIVIINGKESQLDSRNMNEYGGDHSLYVRPDHTYIFDLQKIIKFEDNLDEALLNKEWNHMEIMYKDKNNHSMFIESGIHVFKQKNRIEDIRFTDPTLEESTNLQA
ncbi:disease resistance protein RUN1-like isoform X2 [Trifolium pratense]|uniref:disease resistance protein RUN1-like isoform X2 n=1 Tax=Trifolium pratense TaxID=57577 RepID=UPI001E693F77|nr:disease resistance protein RUN1-like isoform X2 [Trifolium pratense]